MNHEPDPLPQPGRGHLQDVGDSLSRAFRLIQAPPARHDQPSRPAQRIHTNPEAVGEDLLKLVLTLVELLRQLIERQALRRVDAGDLTDEQEEELGATLLALHDTLADLCAEHGYALEDLNLDLGPLGPLLPPAD
ncbi:MULTISPECIES: gas vesicle protein K [unclassified Streptomyces]|uniref:gas vesicle protein K n=1 Tax=unclassified Streptomyces TaxID=2593676 RepID=UPI002E135A93|nr:MULTISPECIES: gas vesicle protein K [unclassified Streptomyces]WSR23925.1 gas vesicle protein K [Streptomyces sp. NBC_01205]